MEYFVPDPNDFTRVIVSEDSYVPRYIVCAANRYNDLVICSPRHHGKHMNSVILAMREAGMDIPRRGEQGFMDQYGLFVTREEAAIIVKTNNQHLVDPKVHRELFSENLY